MTMAMATNIKEQCDVNLKRFKITLDSPRSDHNHGHGHDNGIVLVLDLVPIVVLVLVLGPVLKYS